MTGSTFRIGLVQMRAGRTPAANLDAVAKLIGEAKEAGADYVQTPEMTNIMEVSRDKLFATIVPEESDASLATFRELARKLSIHLHIGSLAVKATPDKAANRGFLIDDVLTSGATSDACARALLRAGARSVDLLVFARVVDAVRAPI